MKARILLTGIELETVRRSPGAAADQRGDLGAAVGGADVVPALAFSAEGDPVALAVGPDPQAVGVLSIALAVTLDDRADGLGPGAARQPSDPPVGPCMPPSDGWAA
jgi:hypothetical protein